MNYKAVVFDLDGTLIDSIEDLGNAVNKSLKLYGFPVHELEKYRYFIGGGAKVMVTRALPEDKRSDENIAKCLEKFNEIYDETFVNNTSLYDEIPELLNILIQKKLNVAILTNKPIQFTLKFVENLLSEWSFDMVVGSGDGLPRKPDPAGANKIMNYLNVNASEVIYLGDSGVDMKTAVKSGMLPVGVLWGFRDAEELLIHGAKHLISKPLELLNIIEN